MKIFYLTTSAFADNQISLIHHFTAKHKVIYGVILPVKNSNYTEKELADYCALHNIEFMLFKLKYRFRDPRVFITYYQAVRAVKKANPDVTLVANFDQLYLNILLMLLDRKTTIIAMHDVVNHSKTAFNTFMNLGKKILYTKFNKFLTYSKSQTALLKAMYPEKQAYTIPLPLIGFGDMPVVVKPTHVTTFLFFGNILHYKGLDILLQAVSRLATSYTNFKLIIAGRCGDWEQTYKPLITNPAVVSANIRFIENSEIPDYFAQANYLVLPYRDTTQSGPLMIAYRYNVPVIASNADGFKEFFKEGTSGFMFDLNKPDNIDAVLTEAINRTPDEYASLKKKLTAYTHDNFAISKLVESYENMFNDVVNTPKADYATSVI